MKTALLILALALPTLAADSTSVKSRATNLAALALAKTVLATGDAIAAANEAKSDYAQSCTEIKVRAAIGQELSMAQLLSYAANCNKKEN